MDRRAARHEATRREILTVAWRLADRDGVAAISLRELAGEVGMRAPSLYTYFPSKDALYDAMFAEGYTRLREQAEHWANDGATDDPIEALGRAAQAFLRFCQASTGRYQLMFTRAVPAWRPSSEAYAVSERQYRRMAQIVASLGITDGDGLDLYTAVTAGLAAQQMANDPTGDRWVRLAPRAIRMLLGHLGDPAEHRPDRPAQPDQVAQEDRS